MSIQTSKYMYNVQNVDGNFELDYLDSPLPNVDLPTETTIRLTVVMQYRPDLVSLKAFGNYNMGWLIALHNDFLDPIYDFEIGREVKIPNLDSYYRYYNANSRRR